MAILPPTPDPNQPKESHRDRSLHDRAFFLGDFGRSDPNQRTRESKEVAKKVFERCLDEAEESSGAETGRRDGPPAPEDTNLENVQDAERTSKRSGEKETERHAGGWRGPNPLLGLGVVPNFFKPMAAPIGETDRSQAQRQAKKGGGTQTDPASAPVDLAILQQLRQAGLSNPLSGFHDFRVHPDHALLSATDGWTEQTVPGGKTYHWQQPGGPFFQRLRVTEGEGLLESSASGQRQIIHKSHGEYSSTLIPQDEGSGPFG